MSPKGTTKEVGIREGEKLHEVMITESDSFNTYMHDDYYIIYPTTYEWWSEKRMKKGGVKVEEFFRYASDTNTEWLSSEEIRERVAKLDFGE